MEAELPNFDLGIFQSGLRESMSQTLDLPPKIWAGQSENNEPKVRFQQRSQILLLFIFGRSPFTVGKFDKEHKGLDA